MYLLFILTHVFQMYFKNHYKVTNKDSQKKTEVTCPRSHICLMVRATERSAPEYRLIVF